MLRLCATRSNADARVDNETPCSDNRISGDGPSIFASRQMIPQSTALVKEIVAMVHGEVIFEWLTGVAGNVLQVLSEEKTLQ